MKTLEEFDKILVKVIDETLRYSLGDRTVEIFYEYLKRRGFTLSDIPRDPDFFFEELRAVLEFEDSGMRFRRISGIGVVSIIERTIVEILCRKFGLEFNEKGPIIFSQWIEKIREAYSMKSSNSTLNLVGREVRTIYGKGKHSNSG
ncbi:MAG: hypothetical protein QW734_06250 [Candidatus Bathyarchaeia archaeon]|nr:hypothetical protein [Candidatus Bathyarchaeota archaeon]